MNNLNVYLADDHAIVVEGLIEILKAQPGINVLGTAANGEEVLTLMQDRPADIVILDINMPKINGIQCTRLLKQSYPGVKVIVLTMFPERSYIDQLIHAGADGCLLKSRGSKDLIEAIARVSAKRSYFDTVQDFTGDKLSRSYNLSDREADIIKLIANGLTSAEIADHLYISEHTVKTHRKNIFRKLNINSISQLTSFAINNGMLP